MRLKLNNLAWAAGIITIIVALIITVNATDPIGEELVRKLIEDGESNAQIEEQLTSYGFKPNEYSEFIKQTRDALGKPEPEVIVQPSKPPVKKPSATTSKTDSSHTKPEPIPTIKTSTIEKDEQAIRSIIQNSLAKGISKEETARILVQKYPQKKEFIEKEMVGGDEKNTSWISSIIGWLWWFVKGFLLLGYNLFGPIGEVIWLLIIVGISGWTHTYHPYYRDQTEPLAAEKDEHDHHEHRSLHTILTTVIGYLHGEERKFKEMMIQKSTLLDSLTTSPLPQDIFEAIRNETRKKETFDKLTHLLTIHEINQKLREALHHDIKIEEVFIDRVTIADRVIFNPSQLAQMKEYCRTRLANDKHREIMENLEEGSLSVHYQLLNAIHLAHLLEQRYKKMSGYIGHEITIFQYVEERIKELMQICNPKGIRRWWKSHLDQNDCRYINESEKKLQHEFTEEKKILGEIFQIIEAIEKQDWSKLREIEELRAQYEESERYAEEQARKKAQQDEESRQRQQAEEKNRERIRILTEFVEQSARRLKFATPLDVYQLPEIIEQAFELTKKKDQEPLLKDVKHADVFYQVLRSLLKDAVVFTTQHPKGTMITGKIYYKIENSSQIPSGLSLALCPRTYSNLEDLRASTSIEFPFTFTDTLRFAPKHLFSSFERCHQSRMVNEIGSKTCEFIEKDKAIKGRFTLLSYDKEVELQLYAIKSDDKLKIPLHFEIDPSKIIHFELLVHSTATYELFALIRSPSGDIECTIFFETLSIDLDSHKERPQFSFELQNKKGQALPARLTTDSTLYIVIKCSHEWAPENTGLSRQKIKLRIMKNSQVIDSIAFGQGSHKDVEILSTGILRWQTDLRRGTPRLSDDVFDSAGECPVRIEIALNVEFPAKSKQYRSYIQSFDNAIIIQKKTPSGHGRR